MKLGWWLGILLLLVGPANLAAQSQVSGRIFDETNLQPIENVAISIGAGDPVAISDGSGYFELELDPSADAIILNHVGYESQTLDLSGNLGNLHILLKIKSFQLEGVLISGTTNSQELLEVPGAISLISRKELQRDNQTSVAESLNRVPGLFMHSGTLSTNRITIRGIGSRSLFSTTKIRAYLNDIPLTTGDGETTLEDIDLSLVDRIEVIKGPASSIYGAGLGGTINMKASKADYASTSASNEFSIGSFGLIRNVSNFNLGKDRINLKINFNTTHHDGYRENNEYDRKNLNVLSQFYPGKNNSITFLGSWIDLKAFIPSSIDSADFAEDPTQAAFTWGQTRGFEDYRKGLLGINYLQALQEQWDISLSVFGNFRDTYELRPFNILSEKSAVVGSRFKSNYVYETAVGKLEWVMGGEYFREHYQWSTFVNDDRVAGNLLSDNDEIRSYYNIFTEINWSLATNTVLTTGINFNRTQYDYQDLFLGDGNDQSGDYQFENQWSPRLAINHKFNTTQSLYAQVSHGFSPPALSETLTPDGAINPEIQPETGYNFEVGTRGQLKRIPFWWDVSIYSMYIKNLLVARRTGDDIFVGINAGKTRHRGIDLSLNYKLDLSTLQVHIWSTYGFADYIFKEFMDEDNDFSGNELTGTPKHKFSAGVDFDHNSGLFGNVNFLSVSAMPLRDDNILNSDNYGLVNVKLGFQKTLAKSFQLKLYCGINNVFDSRYASMILVNASSFGGNAPRYFYPGLPINYYGGLSIQYKFN